MKLTLVAGLGVLAALALATPAAAADGPDLAAARQPATQATAALSRFLGGTPTLGSSVAAYELNPGFVRAESAPVTVLSYVATTATANGRAATVQSVQSQGRWTVVNIASGDDEAAYAARAAALGGTAFTEPQIHAWYALTAGRVVPLNADARKSVGPAGVTVAAYHALVAGRYGDKLPGSAYDKAGLAGGYGAPSRPATWPWYALGGLIVLGLVGLPRLRLRPRSRT